MSNDRASWSSARSSLEEICCTSELKRAGMRFRKVVCRWSSRMVVYLRAAPLSQRGSLARRVAFSTSRACAGYMCAFSACLESFAHECCRVHLSLALEQWRGEQRDVKAMKKLRIGLCGATETGP
jgi:hypothetical protein